jgi:hypothetical protein
MLLLGIALSGCGASTAQGAQSTPSSGNNYLTDDNPTMDATVAGLHIHSDGINCGSGIVLATSRLSYDAAEIQSMSDYFGNAKRGHAGPLPSTLRDVHLGVIQTLNTLEILGEGCLADLQITNTGNTTVEIVRAGVKLLATPVRNAYRYRFVDVCTIEGKPPEACTEGGSGGPMCGVFVADLKLRAYPAGTLVDTPVAPGRDVPGTVCPAERPLKHGDSIEVLLHPLAASSSANFAYRVVPVLTIKTSSGQHVVEITPTGSWLVFASPSQYVCYGLHGHTFTVEARGLYAMDRFGNVTGCI